MADEPLNHREISLLNQSLRDLTATLESFRMEISSTYVRKDVIEPQLAEIRRDIKGHDDWLVWAQRIVLGLVISGLVGLVLYQGGLA